MPPVGARLRQQQEALLRERPWCGLCERFGRHLDPASPDEGPRCVYWPEGALEGWNTRALAVIETWDLIKSLWPEVVEAAPLRATQPAIGESLFERIKAAYRVEDVARRLTDLRGRGESLSGKCPLHREVRGFSFVVWPISQTWRCYGACAKGGDVIDLVHAAKEAGLRV